MALDALDRKSENGLLFAGLQGSVGRESFRFSDQLNGG
jgi:hypothetical protein